MKEINQHQKRPADRIWHAHRLEGKVRNTGIRPVRKPKQQKKDFLK
jgi:hypothetical protein